MVGVPGKYKGCETCRRRRVKCTNERPACAVCLNTGRQCDGYERERVFITGTPETKGRVASHPKRRCTAASKQQPEAEPAEPAKRQPREPRPLLTPVEPLTSAWDDSLALSDPDPVAPLLVTGLHTDLRRLVEHGHGRDSAFDLLLPAYAPLDLRARPAGDDFDARARCLVSLGDGQAEPASAGGYCALLFDNSPSAAPSPLALPGQSSFHETGLVRGLGPEAFAAFPHHQYFVRVHRPLATSLALLGRRDSFLSRQDWLSVPWSWHPKSAFDFLLDVVLRLPVILAGADELLPQPATLSRRLAANGLLQSCLVVEMQLQEWLQSVIVASGSQQPPYWYYQPEEDGGQFPFAAPYAFRDGSTALMMVYYWMAQMPLHRCVESLHMAIFEPVVDDFPPSWPGPSPDLQTKLTPFQDGRELADNISRGLDAALDGTTQPDLLLAPLTVALEFYRGLGPTPQDLTPQDGILEILWLEAFRKRLTNKGQHIASVLQRQQRWVEVAEF